jgi:hypothetical protein
MRPEAQLWKWLRDQTSSDIDWTRLEAVVGAGVADLTGAVRRTTEAPTIGSTTGIEFWLELKVVTTKSFDIKRDATKWWRPQQIGWQTRRAMCGIEVFNLVHRPSSSLFALYSGAQLTAGGAPLTEVSDHPPHLKSIIQSIISRMRREDDGGCTKGH